MFLPVTFTSWWITSGIGILAERSEIDNSSVLLYLVMQVAGTSSETTAEQTIKKMIGEKDNEKGARGARLSREEKQGSGENEWTRNFTPVVVKSYAPSVFSK
ncbi:MAG: hypothetical protein ACREBS_12075 [Nitrososphaerales archaeon]